MTIQEMSKNMGMKYMITLNDRDFDINNDAWFSTTMVKLLIMASENGFMFFTIEVL